MKPMAPMQPMAPMSGGEHWWPDVFGQPATSGSQDGLRYAFFPDKQRLLVEQNGKLTTYNSGEHRIGGVSQQGSRAGSVTFTDQDGTVDLSELPRVD